MNAARLDQDGGHLLAGHTITTGGQFGWSLSSEERFQSDVIRQRPQRPLFQRSSPAGFPHVRCWLLIPRLLTLDNALFNRDNDQDGITSASSVSGDPPQTRPAGTSAPPNLATVVGGVPVAARRDPDRLMDGIHCVREQLQRVIRGKSEVIDSVLTAMLAEGSVLLEDVPGVGKTTLAKSIAALIDLTFQRVQCTPDLLPADILGSSIFQPGSGDFEFRPGPIFCDLLIADEINRASPRTQSALLEAMAEGQVTVEGQRHDLKQPFMVIATQNPSGFEGTFPLPESQLDRFLFRLSMDYPDVESEIQLLLDQPTDDPGFRLEPVMHGDDLVKLQRLVRDVTVDRKIAEYVVEIVGATRRDSRLRMGCSPRGSKMLLRAAQARATLQGRQFVLPDDIQELAVDVIGHRVMLRNASASSMDAANIIRELIGQIEVPV